MTEKTDEQIADGLDSWWKSGAAVDKAAAEEAAVLAENFQAQRVQTYLESGGQTDMGGFVRPSLMGSRMINWLHMPRGTILR
jgi:hypothetical protein